MNKGCDRMRYGSCQFYKEHVEKTVGGPFPCMEYRTYCSTFDHFKNCPYYSYRNNSDPRKVEEYKRHQEGDAKGSLIFLIILVVIVVMILKACHVI